MQVEVFIKNVSPYFYFFLKKYISWISILSKKRIFDKKFSPREQLPGRVGEGLCSRGAEQHSLQTTGRMLRLQLGADAR